MQPFRLTDPANLLWFAIGLAALVLLWLLSPILTPFLMGGILAFICNPVLDRLARRGLPRVLGVIVVLLALLALVSGLLLIVLPLFYKEVRQLIQLVPGALDHLNTHVAPWLQARFGIEVPLDPGSLKAMVSDALSNSDGLGQRVFNSLRIGGLALIGFVANLLLVPVVLFYLLLDWHLIIARIDHLVPRRWHAQVAGLAREVDAVLGEFLRGQLLVIVVMSLFYTTGLWLVGLEFALPVGLITGILVFVPYVGMLTGLVLASLAALLQFPTLMAALPVFLVFAAGQAIEGMVVTPRLVGNRIGLHPVAVIFALLAFGQVFGFFGVLLALPASAVLLVGLRHLRGKYLESKLYKDADA